MLCRVCRNLSCDESIYVSLSSSLLVDSVFRFAVAALPCAHSAAFMTDRSVHCSSMSGAGAGSQPPPPTTPLKPVRPKRRATNRLSSLDRIAIHDAEMDDDASDDDSRSSAKRGSRRNRNLSKSPHAARLRKMNAAKSPNELKKVWTPNALYAFVIR